MVGGGSIRAHPSFLADYLSFLSMDPQRTPRNCPRKPRTILGVLWGLPGVFLKPNLSWGLLFRILAMAYSHWHSIGPFVRATACAWWRTRALAQLATCSLLCISHCVQEGNFQRRGATTTTTSTCISFVKFGTCFCLFDMAMLAMPINGNGARQDCNACIFPPLLQKLTTKHNT